MLTPYDDFPLHQTSAPITQPASGDPNHYDRYFFNGQTDDGGVCFALAMGLYPNRNVIDAHFSVLVNGTQHCVFASDVMPLERPTAVGPLRVEVLEPLRSIRLTVGAPEPDDGDGGAASGGGAASDGTGVRADLVFTARTAALEEPRQTRLVRETVVMDYTRLTQWGMWSGSITVGGTTYDLNGQRVVGTRDRSWGVRGVGAQVPNNLPANTSPQVFWLWAPVHFDDMCTHLATFEHANGERWMEQAAMVPVLATPDAPTWGPELTGAHGPVHVRNVEHHLTWKPGQREIERATITFDGPAGSPVAGPQTMEFEPIATFRMRGIGYSHAEWGHGAPHGPAAVHTESFRPGDDDPQSYHSIHVQTVCRVRMGSRVGLGVLEQLAIGDHEPSGLTGLFDGWQPPVG